MDEKQILEALQMQPLSDEEKASRHILARLWGPIATCKSKTRNGRKYNKELWIKALSDDLFKEKINNKSLFLELGHPVGREETDMEKVCACIPEMPQIVDDDLYAYVDILDTNNGRLLKTLCDYGFIPGISSRGSGDIMDNDEVDPETFFLETWDIVQLPALKEARLAMCESVDMNAIKLQKALSESYKNASEDEKKEMKEVLDNLEIKLDDDIEEELSDDDIPWATSEEPLVEAQDDDSEIPDAESEEDFDDIEDIEDELEAEPEELEAEEIPEADADDDAEVEEASMQTVADLISNLEDYDKDFNVEFKPIVIDDKEYAVKTLEFDDSEDNKLIVTIDCDSEMNDNIEEVPDEEDAELEQEAEEADDIGDDEVLENLKEIVRQKDDLEEKVKQLKNEQAVRDAEVGTLKEELDKYKLAFNRTSKIAAETKHLEATVKQLTEQVNQKDTQIDKLKKENSVSLTEGFNKSAAKIKTLTEKLSSKETELEEAKQQFNEQANIYKRKLNERTAIVTTYKNRCTEFTESYIAFRASMLGVKPSEITNKLTENYSVSDIDAICDDILTESVNISKLPYGFSNTSRIHLSESAKKIAHKDGYDIDDSLLELAGLK